MLHKAVFRQGVCSHVGLLVLDHVWPADSASEDTGGRGFLSSLFSKDDLLTYSAAIAISLVVREYAAYRALVYALSLVQPP